MVTDVSADVSGMPYDKIPPPDMHSCPVEHSSGHSLPDSVPYLNLAVEEMLVMLVEGIDQNCLFLE